MKLNLSLLLLSFFLISSIISCDANLDPPATSGGYAPQNNYYEVLFYTSDTSFKKYGGYFTVSSYNPSTDNNRHQVYYRVTDPSCLNDKVDTVEKVYLNVNAKYYIDTYKYTPAGFVRTSEVMLSPDIGGCQPLNLY